MGEFEFIAEYLAKIAGPEALDLKDDVAIWTPPSGLDVVISMDTLVEGVHFSAGQFDGALAQKLMRVNVSDVIAKGADPVGYFMSLCLPANLSSSTLEDFCTGLERDQNIYGMKLWGGDTTCSDGVCVLSATIIATIPSRKAVRRSGARPGDIMCVSGTIGDAYLGLQIVQGKLDEETHWLQCYHVPNPPYALRGQIRTYASAALDISDGLIADALHMAKASNVGIEIDLNAVPVSEATRTWLSAQSDEIQARILLVTGGDDYQVLLAIPPDQYKQAVRDMPITKIGTVTQGMGVVCHDGQGNEIAVQKPGYTHF
ncbi:MAG: thiamine-phosphate kinase [Robiginitomaculum sp.]|nr:MAG: thiamine-phosphate kinase [Robiginitomaculum sp.]